MIYIIYILYIIYIVYIIYIISQPIPALMANFGSSKLLSCTAVSLACRSTVSAVAETFAVPIHRGFEGRCREKDPPSYVEVRASTTELTHSCKHFIYVL